MARIRTIKPEFWQDEKLAPLRPIDRLVFLGLISLADDAGRLLDNVKMIDGLLFPYTDDSSRESLETLARLSRIIRYRAPNGQRIIQITNWHLHQRVDRPSKSVLPGPPPEVIDPPTDTERSRDTRETLARDSRDTRDPTMDLGSRKKDLGTDTDASSLRSEASGAAAPGFPQRGQAAPVVVAETREPETSSPGEPDRPSRRRHPAKPDPAFVATVAPYIRTCLWLGNRPPPDVLERHADWDEGRDASILWRLVQDGECEPDEIVDVIKAVRIAGDVPKGPMTALIFYEARRRDRIRRVVHHVRQRASKRQAAGMFGGPTAMGEILRRALAS